MLKSNLKSVTSFEKDYSDILEGLVHHWPIGMSSDSLETNGRTFMLCCMNDDSVHYKAHKDEWGLLMGVYWEVYGL